MLSLQQYYKSFKSYDIRGIRSQEIDADFAYYLAKGLAHYIIAHRGTQATIMIAADTRENNTQLINNSLLALSESGLSRFISAGYHVPGFSDQYPHGICSTAMAYQLSYDTFDYSIVFSASHNSSEYIGIKIFTRENKFIPTTILKEIFTKAWEAHHTQGFIPLSTPQAIALYTDSPEIDENKKKLSDTLDLYFGQLKNQHNFTIDYGHGAAVAYELDYITQLARTNKSLKINNIFTNPDGSFPAHETDTSRFVNYDKLLDQIQTRGDEFGFMFDGDADRLGIVLANGTIMTGDILTAIVAKQALTNGMAEKFESKKIFFEVFSSQVVKQVAAQYGGESTMVRVGRGAFCDQVIAERGLIAGESSAHILFGPFGYAEIPLLALALILKESEEFESFEAMAQQYMSSHKSQVYHFTLSDKDGLMQHIDDSYPDLTKTYVDGVRMDGDGFWFTIRKSGTEDIVKVAGEAQTQEQFESERRKLKELILKYGAIEE